MISTGAALRPAVARPISARGRSVRVVCKAGDKVLVCGAQNQTAARIALQLAKSGYKVTAGVEDVGAAQELLEFARKLELLLPKEADSVEAVELGLADAEGLAAGVQKGAKVVLVAGDADAANRRVDPRALERAVAALSGRGLGQLVLVTPAGGASGTGLFGLGGSKPKPGALSKLEEQVVESGLSYLIVRTASSDRVPDRYGEEASPVVAGLGALPAGLSISRSQVAEAVVEAMNAPVLGGAIVEVGADPAAVAVPLADQLQKVLMDAAVEAQARRAERFGAAASESDEEAGGLLGGLLKTAAGTVKGTAKQLQAAAAEEEEEPAAKPKRGGLFGTQRLARPAPAAAAKAEREEAKAAPAPKRAGGLFGTQRLTREAAQEAAAAAAEGKASGAGTGTTRRGGLFGAQKQQAPAEEESKTVKRGGLFGTAAQKAQAEEQPAARPAPKTVRGRKPLPAPEEPKPRVAAAKQQPKEEAAGEKPKKKGGFLQALGIGQETGYVDEM